MLQQYARAIKATGACILTSATLWLGYEVYTSVNIINNILHTSVLDYDTKKVEYIYWKDSIHQTLSSLEGGEDFITNPFMRWWVAAQKSVAWRLLHIAKVGNLFEKERAISSLAKLKILSDWDYQMLAQASDAQTAVALARSKGCDLRFFLRPPKMYRKPLQGKELKEKVIDLLQAMENRHHHSCLENFLSTYEDLHR